MCKQTEIAKQIVQDHIKNKVNFNFKELQIEIVNNGGILQVEPGYTVGTYVLDLEERGVIDFYAKENIYKVNGF